MSVYGVVEKTYKETCPHTGSDRFQYHKWRLLYCADCEKYLRFAIGESWTGWVPANIFYRILFVWGRF